MTTTRNLIDPELLAGLDMFPPLDLDEACLAGLRTVAVEMMPPLESYARSNVAVEQRRIQRPSDGVEVPVLLYRPADRAGPLPAFLHIHGGGYVFGNAEGSGPGNVRTADEVGCLVVSVDYRLAPETRAPGAVEDCYTALRWIHDHADELGVDSARIAVGGDSAGGGLAAALALMARDRGEVAICFQMLIYPMLDDRTALYGKEYAPECGEFVWTRAANAFGWQCLLGMEPGSADVPRYAAAAREENLAGLPPAYVSVGALDLFLDENLAYARRLLSAGVATELHVWPGAFHGFEFAAEANIAKAAESERRRALRLAFDR